MKDKEALQSAALIWKLADAVEDTIQMLFSNGIVTAGIVIGSIFLASDKLFGVEQLAVCPGSNFVCQTKTAWQQERNHNAE